MNLVCNYLFISNVWRVYVFRKTGTCFSEFMCLFCEKDVPVFGKSR